MTEYYDYVLGLIPTVLMGVSGVLNAAGVSSTAAVPAGAIAALVLMCHAMFVRDPSPDATGVSGTSVGSADQVGSANPSGSVTPADSTMSAGSTMPADSGLSTGSD
jgi:hypothetical protein